MIERKTTREGERVVEWKRRKRDSERNKSEKGREKKKVRGVRGERESEREKYKGECNKSEKKTMKWERESMIVRESVRKGERASCKNC